MSMNANECVGKLGEVCSFLDNEQYWAESETISEVMRIIMEEYGIDE